MECRRSHPKRRSAEAVLVDASRRKEPSVCNRRNPKHEQCPIAADSILSQPWRGEFCDRLTRLFCR
ncbi:hypothetical protein [Cohnella sp. CIP 111063]|uniref:hypothetical protein n=1 Tax=unclassified Cohnella TaxID=2636738 RepID=UPI0035176AC6